MLRQFGKNLFSVRVCLFGDSGTIYTTIVVGQADDDGSAQRISLNSFNAIFVIEPLEARRMLAGHPIEGSLASGTTHLAWGTQPAAQIAGAISPLLEVVLEDQAGSRVFTGHFRVQLKIVSGPAHAKLKGITTAAVRYGIADFPYLLIETAGTYTIEARARGMAPIVSGPFTIAAGPAEKMIFSEQPVNTFITATYQNVQVELLDRYDNLAVGDNSTVWVLDPLLGFAFAGPGSQQANAPVVNGYATLSVSAFGPGKSRLLATDSRGLVPVYSHFFYISLLLH